MNQERAKRVKKLKKKANENRIKDKKMKSDKKSQRRQKNFD